MNDKDFAADNNQAAAKAESFKPASNEIKTQASQSSKIISLEFPTNSAQLNEDDKVLSTGKLKNWHRALQVLISGLKAIPIM